jgi:hypothetical protein
MSLGRSEMRSFFFLDARASASPAHIAVRECTFPQWPRQANRSTGRAARNYPLRVMTMDNACMEKRCGAPRGHGHRVGLQASRSAE